MHIWGGELQFRNLKCSNHLPRGEGDRHYTRHLAGGLQPAGGNQNCSYKLNSKKPIATPVTIPPPISTSV